MPFDFQLFHFKDIYTSWLQFNGKIYTLKWFSVCYCPGNHPEQESYVLHNFYHLFKFHFHIIIVALLFLRSIECDQVQIVNKSLVLNDILNHELNQS